MHAKKIIVIDDVVAANEMMAMGLQFAAPAGTKALCYSVEQAAGQWSMDSFGNGTVMVLFRDVQTAYKTWKAGFKYEKLNIGNIPTAPGRISVYKTCFMNKEEMDLLKELEKEGVEIYLQFMPQEKIVSFDKLKEKLK